MFTEFGKFGKFTGSAWISEKLNYLDLNAIEWFSLFSDKRAGKSIVSFKFTIKLQTGKFKPINYFAFANSKQFVVIINQIFFDLNRLRQCISIPICGFTHQQNVSVILLRKAIKVTPWDSITALRSTSHQ